jgi:hypothetical protein
MIMDGFALIVTPAEAAGLVPGWPPGAWLAVTLSSGGAAAWEAVASEDALPDAVSGLPVWPPAGRLPVAAVTAGAEADLLARIVAEPGLAAAAAARLAGEAPVRPAEVLAEDVEW